MPEPFTQIPLFFQLSYLSSCLWERNWRCPSSDKGGPSQPRAKVGGLLFFTNSPGGVYLALSLPSLFGGAVNFPPPDCLVARQTTNKVDTEGETMSVENWLPKILRVNFPACWEDQLGLIWMTLDRSKYLR